jgi:hypothetical protein
MKKVVDDLTKRYSDVAVNHNQLLQYTSGLQEYQEQRTSTSEPDFPNHFDF